MTLRDEDIRLLEAHADGRLEGAERAAADALLRENPEAAALARGDAQGADALRRLFEPPASFEVRAGPPLKIRAGRPAWVKWALAAGVLLAALGAYTTNFVLVTTPDSVYGKIVDAGFAPYWKCGNDEEFIAYTNSKVGEPLLVGADDGVQVLGWDSADELLTEQTSSLLSTSDGQPVVLFMDRLADDRKLHLRPFSSMHLYRGQLGGAVFYEVSRLDHPVILPRIHRPGEPLGMAMPAQTPR